MRTTPIRLVLAAAVFVGLSFTLQAPTRQSETPTVHKRALVTLTGASSKAERGVELARTEPNFIRLWQRHIGAKETGEYNAHYNEIGLPVVDFDRCMVVAIFEGDTWNSAGFSVHSIFERSGRLILRYEAKSYQTSGPDGGGRQASPYAFFVLPRFDKEIVMERNVQRLIRGGPVWKQQASFPAK